MAGLVEERCGEDCTYKRPQAGTEPSDENDGYKFCQLHVATAQKQLH